MISKKVCIGLSVLLLVSSCRKGMKKTKPHTVRIVDSKGNPTLLNRRTPEFNKKQISKQQMSDPNIRIMNGNVDYNQNGLPKDIFADKSSQKKAQVNKADNGDKVIFKTTEQEKQLKRDLVQKKESASKKSVSKSTKTKKTAVASSTASRKSTSKKKYSSDKGTFYIQIGAYKDKVNAKKSLKKYSGVRGGTVKSYKSRKGVVIYRTVLGPYNSKSQAERDLEKVIQRGHYDVYITRK